MGKRYNKLPNKLKDFINQQRLFFIATAPTGEGQTYIAPKSNETLKLLDDSHILYWEYKGNETEVANHLRDNGKITFMWCSFDAKPCILRAFGKGEVINKETDDFAILVKQYFPNCHEQTIGELIKVRIHDYMTSCGFGVPFMTFIKDTETAQHISEKTKKTNQDFQEFILNQKMFFIGTAPTGNGEVHVALKGYNTLRIIDDMHLLYLDYYGSENETAIHLRENGKITVMWCGFDSSRSILRAFGKGEVICKGTDDFTRLLSSHFATFHEKMVRQIFSIKLDNFENTSEIGVPLLSYIKDRDTLHKISDLMLVKNPAGKLFQKVFPN